MTSRDQVLEVIRSMKNRATLSEIYASLAKRWNKQQLMEKEKHNTRSAAFSLKAKGLIKQTSPSTYKASE